MKTIQQQLAEIQNIVSRLNGAPSNKTEPVKRPRPRPFSKEQRELLEKAWGELEPGFSASDLLAKANQIQPGLLPRNLNGDLSKSLVSWLAEYAGAMKITWAADEPFSGKPRVQVIA